MTEYFKRIETSNPDRDIYLQSDLVIDRHTKFVVFDNTTFINENHTVDQSDYDDLEKLCDKLEAQNNNYKYLSDPYKIENLEDEVDDLKEEIKEKDDLISNLSLVLSKTPEWLQRDYINDSRFIEEMQKQIENEKDLKQYVYDLTKRLKTVFDMVDKF